MDTTKLSIVLKKAESSGITLVEVSQEIQPWQKETYALNNLKVEKEIEDELLETIKEISEFSVFDEKLFNCGSCAIRVNLEQIKKCILYSTYIYGAQKTLGNIDKYFELDGNPICEIQLISGIEIENEIEIIDNTNLVPFDNIPECWQKNHFSPLLYEFPDNKYCSKAAIVRTRKATPKSWRQDERPEKSFEVDIHLYDICALLTLIGPSAPYPTTMWTLLDEIIPLRLETGLFGNTSFISYSVYKYESKDYVFAKDIVRSYLSLSKNLKNTLLLSIKRLNMAQRKNIMEDKAIDLGIALEILLLHDREKYELIAFPFRLRGAWFLGEGERRRFVYDLLSAIYDCRCSAVHSGKLRKNKYKINDQNFSLEELFKEGFKICADLIIKIIKTGKFPDWNNLILRL